MNRYQEVEELLRNYNMMKIGIKNIKREIDYIKNDISLTGFDYAGISVSPTNKISSTTENEAIGIIDQVEELNRDIEYNKKEIEKVDNALLGLNEYERVIVVEYYINSLQWCQVIAKVDYSERHAKRIRNVAIDKLIIGIYGKIAF